MIKISLTIKEVRALLEVLNNQRVCSSGCIYEDMQQTNIECCDCEFTKSLNSVESKINDSIKK